MSTESWPGIIVSAPFQAHTHPQGSYQADTTTTTCDPCPAGQYGAAAAATACIACSPGSYAAVAGTSTCASCAAGSVQSAAGATVCLLCAAAAGVATERGATACQLCAAGTFRASGTECRYCAAGSFASRSNGTACVQCQAGTAGLYPGATACVGCAAGSYSSSVGAVTCTGCASGSFAPAAGASACGLCPNGTYSPLGGSGTQCQSCPAYSLSPAGSGGPADCLCLAGYYFVMPAANTTTSSVSSGEAVTTACAPCAAGTYKAVAGSLDSCNRCPPGKFSPAAAATSMGTCASCPAGWAADVSGVWCIPLGPGNSTNPAEDNAASPSLASGTAPTNGTDLLSPTTASEGSGAATEEHGAAGISVPAGMTWALITSIAVTTTAAALLVACLYCRRGGFQAAEKAAEYLPTNVHSLPPPGETLESVTTLPEVLVRPASLPPNESLPASQSPPMPQLQLLPPQPLLPPQSLRQPPFKPSSSSPALPFELVLPPSPGDRCNGPPCMMSALLPEDDPSSSDTVATVRSRHSSSDLGRRLLGSGSGCLRRLSLSAGDPCGTSYVPFYDVDSEAACVSSADTSNTVIAQDEGCAGMQQPQVQPRREPEQIKQPQQPVCQQPPLPLLQPQSRPSKQELAAQPPPPQPPSPFPCRSKGKTREHSPTVDTNAKPVRPHSRKRKTICNHLLIRTLF